MLSVPIPTTPDSDHVVQALLPLKLSVPPPRAGVLLRPDLQALLSEVRLNLVTLVVAPAGYGKSTLLAQWYQELTRTGAPVAWLTLDTSERNPGLFLAYLIGAFQTVFPSIGVDAWRILQSAANLERDWPLVAGSLCSDLQRKVATAGFLVLDDVHTVADSAVINQILAYLLRAAPPTLHIVLSSRRAPTFAPLARLRTEGRLAEVTQRDLNLSSVEVRQILSTQDVLLSDAELDLLLDRTKGWALSVQLAARALAAQPQERRGEFVQALGGGQEQILSYLASEVLAELPQELIEFLQLAALPAYFDAPLLTEVLGRDDVGYLIQRAQALGLPIQPLDEQSGRLHFHPLWRELLQRGSAETMPQGRLVELHRRFGQALERLGDLESALEHYAQADATEDLVRALRERAWPLLRSPQRELVRRWLDQLAPQLREADADLLHMWGVSLATSDPLKAASTIARAAELYDQSGQFEQRLDALADIATLTIGRISPSDSQLGSIALIKAANDVDAGWARGAARIAVAILLYTKGRDEAALRVGHQATLYPIKPTWRWIRAMVVGTITNRLGRPSETISAIDDALSLLQVDLDDRLRQNLLLLRSFALYLQGDVTDAISLLQAAHRHLADYYRGGIAGGSAFQLGLMLTLQGRVDEAITMIAQARAIFQEQNDPALLFQVQVIEIYTMMLRGQAANARTAVNAVLRRFQETNSYVQDLSIWLLLVLVLGEGGEHQRAIWLAGEIARRMEPRGYRLPLAALRLYSAFLAGQLGDASTRERELRAGWALMEADDLRYLPWLPPHVVRDVVTEALRAGVAPETAGKVIRRQLPEQALEMLQGLLAEPAPAVRANVARLLGDLGEAMAFPALRPLLKDRDAAVRQAAEDALSRIVYRPPYTLRVRTLGAFGLWRGDQEVRDRDWRSSKARQLFQLLITERGRTLPRDRILDMLWPEMEPEAAANNLRVTLNRLGKAIEPDRPEGAPSTFILQQGDTFSFNTHSDHQLDAVDFDAAVSEGQRAERRAQRQAAITAFRRAVGLYGGPYLPDNLYEDWTVVERERLAMLFNDAALRLGALLLDEGQAHEAIGLGWRVLENDQSHEEAYRLLMRAHMYLGERSTALRLYTRCVSVLKSELGVDPLPETVALYNSIREMR